MFYFFLIFKYNIPLKLHEILFYLLKNDFKRILRFDVRFVQNIYIHRIF